MFDKCAKAKPPQLHDDGYTQQEETKQLNGSMHTNRNILQNKLIKHFIYHVLFLINTNLVINIVIFSVKGTFKTVMKCGKEELETSNCRLIKWGKKLFKRDFPICLVGD